MTHSATPYIRPRGSEAGAAERIETRGFSTTALALSRPALRGQAEHAVSDQGEVLAAPEDSAPRNGAGP